MNRGPPAYLALLSAPVKKKLQTWINSTTTMQGQYEYFNMTAIWKSSDFPKNIRQRHQKW